MNFLFCLTRYRSEILRAYSTHIRLKLCLKILTHLGLCRTTLLCCYTTYECPLCTEWKHNIRTTKFHFGHFFDRISKCCQKTCSKKETIFVPCSVKAPSKWPNKSRTIKFNGLCEINTAKLVGISLEMCRLDVLEFFFPINNNITPQPGS